MNVEVSQLLCQYDTTRFGRDVPVDSFTQAAEVCRAYIERNDTLASVWSGGAVTVQNRVVANVAYNGRVFTPEGWPDASEIVEGVA